MNEQLLQDTNIKEFVNSVNSLKDMDEDLFTDESITEIINNIDQSFSKEQMNQAVNQIIQNLENQNTSRVDAQLYVAAIKDFVNQIVYGDTIIVGNKRKVIDAIVEKIYSIFDTAVDKYHSYAIELPIQLEEGAHVPTYAHVTDAAADLYALETTILEGNSLGNKIRTGVKIQLPEGWVAMIFPRSSIGAKTALRLSNSAGIIDSSYRGELGVLYDNISDTPHAINAGDRIAQLLVMPSYRFKANIVDSLEDSDRGEGGFGSTGT